MIGRLLIAAAVLGLSEQAYVMKGCGCGDALETFAVTTTAAYCPITTVKSCNTSILVDNQCTISCPYPRASVYYRNATATFISTSSIKCEDNVLTNADGKKITMLQRPTCGILQPCDLCLHTLETTACPPGQTCNQDNFKRTVDSTDDCGRITCDNSATLTLYYANKTVLPFTNANKLYCLIGGKWANFSLNGGLGAGTAVPDVPFSVNCRLPAGCETCLPPNIITDPATQLPEAFRTGYNRVDPTVTKTPAQCTTVTCPNSFILMGFVGTTATQTGVEHTSQNFLRCAENGQWSNNGLGYPPQAMKYTCMQKILPCPPIENVLGNGFTIACNEQTKVSTLTCPTGTKLILRYSTSSSTIKYDKATFFSGKGWLAHGCDSTAALFTTASGLAISGACMST